MFYSNTGHMEKVVRVRLQLSSQLRSPPFLFSPLFSLSPSLSFLPSSLFPILPCLFPPFSPPPTLSLPLPVAIPPSSSSFPSRLSLCMFGQGPRLYSWPCVTSSCDPELRLVYMAIMSSRGKQNDNTILFNSPRAKAAHRTTQQQMWGTELRERIQSRRKKKKNAEQGNVRW